jgi:hypothetical protein
VLAGYTLLVTAVANASAEEVYMAVREHSLLRRIENEYTLGLGGKFSQWRHRTRAKLYEFACSVLSPSLPYRAQLIEGQGVGIVMTEKWSGTVAQLQKLGLRATMNLITKQQYDVLSKTVGHMNLYAAQGRYSVLYGPVSLLNTSNPHESATCTFSFCNPPILNHKRCRNRKTLPLSISKYGTKATARAKLTLPAGRQLLVGYGTAYKKLW